MTNEHTAVAINVLCFREVRDHDKLVEALRQDSASVHMSHVHGRIAY